MKHPSLKNVTIGALIAALYAALTALSASLGLAIGPFEFRVSEALVVLPVFTPAAVPGLLCGCFAANLLCGGHIVDVIVGSFATLLGALGTRALRKKPSFALLPPILANTVLVPPVLFFIYGFAHNGYWLLLISFFVGEAVSAGGFGYLLYRALLPIRKYFE